MLVERLIGIVHNLLSRNKLDLHGVGVGNVGTIKVSQTRFNIQAPQIFACQRCDFVSDRAKPTPCAKYGSPSCYFVRF